MPTPRRRSIARNLIGLTILAGPGVVAGNAIAAPPISLITTATAGFTATDTLTVTYVGTGRFQFQMNHGGAGNVRLTPNQANQRIAPSGTGCVALPPTAAPNQGVFCENATPPRLVLNLGPDADSFFFVGSTSPPSNPYNLIPVQAGGAAGADRITTLNGDDAVNGGGGNDTLVTGGGADDVRGNTGRDTIDAGAGDDRITTNEVFDRAGAEADTITCGPGVDSVASDLQDTVAADCENVSSFPSGVPRNLSINADAVTLVGRSLRVPLHCPTARSDGCTGVLSARLLPGSSIGDPVDYGMRRGKRKVVTIDLTTREASRVAAGRTIRVTSREQTPDGRLRKTYVTLSLGR